MSSFYMIILFMNIISYYQAESNKNVVHIKSSENQNLNKNGQIRLYFPYNKNWKEKKKDLKQIASHLQENKYGPKQTESQK